jgi:hypothetical protein
MWLEQANLYGFIAANFNFLSKISPTEKEMEQNCFSGLLYTKGQKAYKNKIICNNVSVGYCN